jgi:ABC-2 type transport system permease protein
MNVRGIAAVVGVEAVKLGGQIKTYLVLATCLAGPFAFAVVIRLQSSLPSDTLFGRAVKESGFAIPLVLLGFAALWAFPVLTSIVGGDLFSGEDRYGTWKLVLTRSCSRADVFAGKVIAGVSFAVLAILVFAASSIAAGMLVIGVGPLIDLSGIPLPPGQALNRVVLAWLSIVAPALAFTAFAVLLSVISRNSVIGVGLPVVVGLVLQLAAMLDGPEVFRRLLITSAFGAWHGLFVQPSYYRPLFDGTVLSSACFVLCLALAFRSLRRRDISG